MNYSKYNLYEENYTTTDDPTVSEPQNVVYKCLKTLASLLTVYCTPVITIAGTIGNILSVIVFLRTKLKKLSSSYYLAFLAIFDTGFLWCYFIEWLNIFEIDIYKRNGFCQFFTWLSNACSVLSVWLVVAFTVERFVAVMYPLKRPSMYTVTRARAIVFTLVVFNAISSAPLLLLAERVKKDDGKIFCTVHGSYFHLMEYYNYYDFFVAFVIPLTLIVTLNTVTAFAVWKSSKVGRTIKTYNRFVREKSVNFRRSSRRDHSLDDYSHTTMTDLEISEPSARITMCRLLNGHQSMRQSCPEHHQMRCSSKATQMKVTKMLLVISTVFIILNLPSYVIRVWIFTMGENYVDYWHVLLQYFAQVLFLCNFGINFVLYCLSGQNFRKELMGLFKRRVPNRHHTFEPGTPITIYQNRGFPRDRWKSFVSTDNGSVLYEN